MTLRRRQREVERCKERIALSPMKLLWTYLIIPIDTTFFAREIRVTVTFGTSPSPCCTDRVLASCDDLGTTPPVRQSVSYR